MIVFLRRAGTALFLYVALLTRLGAPPPSPSSGERRFPRATQEVSGDADAPSTRRMRLDRSVPGPDESREGLGGPSSYEEEKLANRAFPNDTIPWDQTEGAQKAVSDVVSFHDGDENMPFAWRSLGPTNAVYPALLNRTSVPYVTSGRITALAIDPNCTEDRCRLYVAAAGGGIWRTNDALDNDPRWKFISGSFATNAIGALTIDPTAGALYAGTGEPNVSGDSEAGMGIYRSTDGGDTWSLLPAVATIGPNTFANFAKGRSVSGIAIDPGDARTLYVGTARGVRGVSSVAGGSTTVPPDAAPFGLYKSTDGGASFSLIWDGAGTFRGVNAVALDPGDPKTVYAAAFQGGIWRSQHGAAFEQVFEGQSQLIDPDRTEFALALLPNGHTRIYAGDGAVGPPPPGSPFRAPDWSESQVWRLDDANQPAAALLAGQRAAETGGVAPAGGWKKLTSSVIGTPGYATYNYCTGQCWYDNAIFSPPGHPDTVLVIGSYLYNEAGRTSNARAVLRSTTAGEPDANGVTFTDQTRDASSDTAPNGIHPDQHAMAFVPGHPETWFEGSDGGLMRASGAYSSISHQCDGRRLSPARLLTCKRLLSSVPTLLTSLNFGLNTLQFQSLSINPAQPRKQLLGGTQDNGTFLFTGSRVTWNQVIFGDGGQSGFNAATPSTSFHTYFSSQVDSNFRNADPLYWVWISDPFFVAPTERSAFYITIIPDPNPVKAGSIFAGLQSVWRTTDNGGDQSFLEANCGELLPAADPNAFCGDWVKIGPVLATSAGNFIAAVARTPGDTSTLWVATRFGAVFVSHNADAAPSAVTFQRIDTLSPAAPNRFVSGIYVDPGDSSHAFLSYSGYSAATPTRPGHVFEVRQTATTATWTSLDGGTGPMGDLPVTAVVRDDPTGDLYAATDFGVLRKVAGSGHWHLAGTGMPAVEVAGLSISTSSRVLYAATHGRGAFRLALPGGDDD